MQRGENDLPIGFQAHCRAASEGDAMSIELKQGAQQALALPTDDVRSILQDALNVLGCLEYGITGVDSWPCEDSVEDVVHRIRKVLEESQ